MTILPKKKNKDKSQQEQSGHGGQHTQSGESSRVNNGGSGGSRHDSATSARGARNRHPSVNHSNNANSTTFQASYGGGTDNAISSFASDTTEGSSSNPVVTEAYPVPERHNLKVSKRNRQGRSPKVPPYSKGSVRHPPTTWSSNSSGTSGSSSIRGQKLHRHKLTDRSKSLLQVACSSSRGSQQRRRQQQQQQQQQRARVEDDFQRYNSEDEYDEETNTARVADCQVKVDFEKKDQEFEILMKKEAAFHIEQMDKDGNCLFRAVAYHVYGDQDRHGEVRHQCMEYMKGNSDHYASFVAGETFQEYIERKRQPGVHGNNLEMQAMAEIYNRSFEVYEYSIKPRNTFQSSQNSSYPPIRLSYHQGCHYNAVFQPNEENSFGKVLGYPAHLAGLPEQCRAMDKLYKTSEQDFIGHQMLMDKMKATDRDFTDEEILKQVQAESLRSLHLMKKPTPTTARVGDHKDDSNQQEGKEKSAHDDDDDKQNYLQQQQQHPCSSSQKFPPLSTVDQEQDKPSPSEAKEKSICKYNKEETASNVTVADSSTIVGRDWVLEEDEASILQQVLARSQAMYLETLREQHQQRQQQQQQQQQQHQQQQPQSTTSSNSEEHGEEDSNSNKSPSASCSRYPTNSSS